MAAKPTFEECLAEAYEEHVEAFYEENAIAFIQAPSDNSVTTLSPYRNAS